MQTAKTRRKRDVARKTTLLYQPWKLGWRQGRACNHLRRTQDANRARMRELRPIGHRRARRRTIEIPFSLPPSTTDMPPQREKEEARANFLSGKGVMRACSAAHWEEYFVVCESDWASWSGRRPLGRQPRTDRRPAITTKNGPEEEASPLDANGRLSENRRRSVCVFVVTRGFLLVTSALGARA